LASRNCQRICVPKTLGQTIALDAQLGPSGQSGLEKCGHPSGIRSSGKRD
jgi:hypothetical protein